MQNFSSEERIQLARLIMEMLDDWGVTHGSKIGLLGLPADMRPRALARYYDNTPLPDAPDVDQRVEHLMGISEALRTSYPLNTRMAGVWLNRVNRRFGDRSPLATMLEDGLEGIIAVRVHLDCAWDWARDAQSTARPAC